MDQFANLLEEGEALLVAGGGHHLLEELPAVGPHELDVGVRGERPRRVGRPQQRRVQTQQADGGVRVELGGQQGRAAPPQRAGRRDRQEER